MNKATRKQRRKQSERVKRNRTLRRSSQLAGTAITIGALNTTATLGFFSSQQVNAETVGVTGFINTSSYISLLAQYAKPIADANGLYTSVMIAQALLESGWGTSALAQAPYYNLFGIKGSYQGKSVTMKTQEFIDGNYQTVNAAFRRYPSMYESFLDNAYVLKNTSFGNGYYYVGAWKANSRGYQDATAWLQGRYATDPTYAAKLNTIIASYGLTNYDSQTGVATGMIPTNTNVSSSVGATGGGATTSSGTSYTVVAGDYLNKIASQYGVSVANLMSWNGLKSDVIYIGQKLIVSNKGATTPTSNQQTTLASTSTYMVVAGDYLNKIANQYGVSVANLKAWNNLTSDTIYIGQKLIVKGGTAQQTVNKTTTTQTTTYTVVAGDYLNKIATKYGVSVASLKVWNNLIGDTIYIGQKLAVKAGATQKTSTPTLTTTTNNTTYMVVAGDYLNKIANQYGVSVANLKAWNNLTSDTIYIGQKLSVKGAATQKGASTSTTNASTTDTTYLVVAGDYLNKISTKYGVSVANLKAWNNLKNDTIYIGQKLVIKGNTTQTVSSTPQASSSASTYKVQSGDTLWAIAQKNKTTIERLQQLNNIKGDVIVIGQTLKL